MGPLLVTSIVVEQRSSHQERTDGIDLVGSVDPTRPNGPGHLDGAVAAPFGLGEPRPGSAEGGEDLVGDAAAVQGGVAPGTLSAQAFFIHSWRSASQV